MAAEPRLVVHLPSRAELLRATAAGERGVQPYRELVSDGTAATGPFHAVLVMQLPNPAQP